MQCGAADCDLKWADIGPEEKVSSKSANGPIPLKWAEIGKKTHLISSKSDNGPNPGPNH